MGIGTGTFILLSLALFPPLLVPTIPKFIVAEDGGLAANLSDLVLGFRIMKLHMRFSSTEINPPALSNSPQ
jgi:hypothetical protein